MSAKYVLLGFVVAGYFAQGTSIPMELANPPFRMNAQVPFRGPSGPMGPSANLFSGIILPEMPTRDSGGSTLEEGGPHKAGGKADDKKQTAIQEKNRRAQKRFRERQKAKMQDMTEQLDDMTSELDKLRVENNALKNRNSILEKVLALRDEHIRMLQDEQQVFDLGSHYLQQQKALAGSEHPKLLTAGAPVSLSPTGAAIITTDLTAIKNMPASAVISQWKELVRELGNLLVEVEGSNPADPSAKTAMEKLCRALDTAGEMCMHTAVLHPTNMQRLIASTLDDGRSGASADDKARWASVATSLQCTDDQRGQIIALRHIFVRRMSRVMEVRRGILSKLKAVAIPDRMVALQSVITETLKVNEATVALKSNLQEEHLCGMEFIGTVFKTILNPMQKARAIVQSYPFYPDVYQIANALAQEDEMARKLVAMEAVDGLMTQQKAPAAGALLEVPTVYKA